MGRKPRSQRPHVPRPSPLQQVTLTRPISTLEVDQPSADMGLVRDPEFWKRFSTAMHKAEEVEATEEPANRGSRSNSGSSGGQSLKKSYSYGDDWLIQQRRDKRRCRIYSLLIAAVVIAIIAAGAICGWYFTHTH
ncbi:hypothetical protein HYALB_00003145 [Hymenoscyphus albidus]|uniref:Uncharacterized protein n=1 Tax=Hymenoscyphus albidus TaxID=595503 RepID=A0A9N9LFJ2_9HELO|nr:hypothetical protein HYALB_00003145 [Hymenoscyphus albidus]